MDTIITIIVTHAVFTILPNGRILRAFVSRSNDDFTTIPLWIIIRNKVSRCCRVTCVYALFYPDSGRRNESFEIEIDPHSPFDFVIHSRLADIQIGDSIEAFFGALLPCYRDRFMHRYALSVRLIYSFKN